MTLSQSLVPAAPAAPCPGRCDGTGIYPRCLDLDFLRATGRVRAPWGEVPLTAYEERALRLAVVERDTEDGYYFLPCGVCGGTGRAGLPARAAYRVTTALARLRDRLAPWLG